MTWQPIETAPTWQPAEGANMFLGRPEVILGWLGSGEIAMGYWEPDRKGGGVWRIAGDARYFSQQPTHWQPLPAPPTADPGIPVYRVNDGGDT